MGAEAGQGIEWSALLDPASLVLTLLGLAIVTASAYRSLIFERETEKRGEVSSENFVTIDTAQALGIPILSSCILLLVFYFFSFISMALVVLMALCAASALAFALTPVVNGFCRWAGSTTLPSAASKQRPGTSAAEVEAHVPRASMSSNALLDPLLCGLSFAQMVLERDGQRPDDTHARIASERRDATVCQPGSYRCQAAAAGRARGGSDRAGVACEADHSTRLVHVRENARERQFLILGLGDLALPSLLLAFALCHDNRKLKAQNSSLTDAARQATRSTFWPDALRELGYFPTCTVGYLLGLEIALMMGVIFRAAQPALLYIVPLTLGALPTNGYLGSSWPNDRLPPCEC
eukprot:scaffold140_cov565-Prasinococcus_capsulatus_cf.AAC.40